MTIFPILYSYHQEVGWGWGSVFPPFESGQACDSWIHMAMWPLRLGQKSPNSFCLVFLKLLLLETSHCSKRKPKQRPTWKGIEYLKHCPHWTPSWQPTPSWQLWVWVIWGGTPPVPCWATWCCWDNLYTLTWPNCRIVSKISEYCCFKLPSFQMVYYAAIDNGSVNKNLITY